MNPGNVLRLATSRLEEIPGLTPYPIVRGRSTPATTTPNIDLMPGIPVEMAIRVLIRAMTATTWIAPEMPSLGHLGGLRSSTVGRVRMNRTAG